jgi:hypothetical protein
MHEAAGSNGRPLDRLSFDASNLLRRSEHMTPAAGDSAGPVERLSKIWLLPRIDHKRVENTGDCILEVGCVGVGDCPGLILGTLRDALEFVEPVLKSRAKAIEDVAS